MVAQKRYRTLKSKAAAVIARMAVRLATKLVKLAVDVRVKYVI